MKNTLAKVRWELLALVVAASVGCEDKDSLLLEESEGLVLTLTDVFVSESEARQHDAWDHCADEAKADSAGYPLPPPWLSYCRNPRPLMTGFVTGRMRAEENAKLKREWEEKHGKTPLRENGVK